MARIVYKKIKDYSGFIVYGDQCFERLNNSSHFERAVQLTAIVETGDRRGSIMAADGTAVTAGRCQHVLVYPRELSCEDFDPTDDQGSLAELLCIMVREIDDNSIILPLIEAFRDAGFVCDGDRIRHISEGQVTVEGKTIPYKENQVVNGSILRTKLTAEFGKVPKGGKIHSKARKWVELFHDLFAHSDTQEIQTRFEVESLKKRIEKTRVALSPKRRPISLTEIFYQGSSDFVFVWENGNTGLSPELDLALCVFHSHSVNAPSKARRELQHVIQNQGMIPQDFGTYKEVRFARALLKHLAGVNYGRWNEQISGGRWARTRKAAMSMECWPKEFFLSRELMPTKFK